MKYGEIPPHLKRQIREWAASRKPKLLVTDAVEMVVLRGMKSLGIPTTEVDGETDGRDTAVS